MAKVEGPESTLSGPPFEPQNFVIKNMLERKTEYPKLLLNFTLLSQVFAASAGAVGSTTGVFAALLCFKRTYKGK